MVKPSKNKKKDKIKEEISKIEKEINKLNIKFPEEKNIKKKEDENKKPEEKIQENKRESSEQKLDQNPEEEIIDFPAPVLTSEKSIRSAESLEQTAFDSPVQTSARDNAVNPAYVGAQSSYLTGNSGYISNQTYRSGNDQNPNQQFKPELDRPGLDRPIFGSRNQQQGTNRNSGFFSPEQARETQNQNEQRFITQYEIKPEETAHHGLRKRKTDIF